MDQDTTKRKHAHAKIIEALELQEIDILVGTQMLAKGLDFRHVSLVGVMNADNLLNFPDFRAHESVVSNYYNKLLVGQVEQKSRGKSNYTDLQSISSNITTSKHVIVLKKCIEQQMEDRYQFKYPPYYRMIKIAVKERSFQKWIKSSIWLAKALKNKA